MSEEKRVKIMRLVFLILGIALIIGFIIALIMTNRQPTYRTDTTDTTAPADGLVRQAASYTYPNSEITSLLPEVEIDSSDAEATNSDLKNRYNQAIRTGNMQFTYQYSDGEKYLSLVAITNRIDPTTGYAYPTFETYTFEKETGKLLTIGELYQLFGKTAAEAASSFEQTIKEYYQQELESMYFTEEMCDYNCFLNLRGINDYSSGIELYVENDELKFYRGFQVFSKYLEEQFYRNEDFKFDFR